MSRIAHQLKRVETLARNRQFDGLLRRLKEAPASVMELAELSPDPWQANILRSNAARQILLCSRQAGKSTVAAGLALSTALVCPQSLVLLLSPSLRQSGELFRKVSDVHRALGNPLGTSRKSTLRLELSNGSRVVSLLAGY